LIIDIQNDYFPGGAYPLVEPEAATAAARVVLEHFRAVGDLVVHVQHIATDVDATFMRPDTDGVQIHDLVCPTAGEVVISKAHPNAFRETRLASILTAAGVDQLVVLGMMTSMCVDATARAAVDLGFLVTVVADACASPDLQFGQRPVTGADVQAAFLAALAGTYADVVFSKSFPNPQGLAIAAAIGVPD
jgi:nicotinamidase-related amidase